MSSSSSPFRSPRHAVPLQRMRFADEAAERARRSSSPRLQRSLKINSPVVLAASEGTRSPMRTASPFRDVLHRAASAPQTRDGKLASLLKEFNDRSLAPSERRAADIIAAFQRSAYLTNEDRVVLESTLARNRGFMANVEAVLNDAVTEQAPMEQCTVRSAYEQWSRVNMMNIRIQKVLDRTQHSQPAAASSAAAVTHAGTLTVGSSSIQLHAQPQYHSLQQVPFKRLGSPLRIVPQTHNTGAPSVSSTTSDARLSELMKKTSVTYEDAREVQELLQRLHGPGEGRSLFLTWLADLPLPTLRAIQAQLPQ